MPLYTTLQHLLNVLVQTANKAGNKKMALKTMRHEMKCKENQWQKWLERCQSVCFLSYGAIPQILVQEKKQKTPNIIRVDCL
jgi:hypothetical protein